MSAISNARWVSLSQGTRILTQVIGMTVLARLLQPHAYGLMAMAAIVTNLAYLFKDMGTSAAVIQAKEISRETASTIHWANLGLGVLICILILLAAPVMATVFREPGLADVLYMLAWVFPIVSFSVVHQALLERESKFAVVAKAEALAALIGLAVALGLAWQGAGVFSLVLQMIVSTVVSTAIILWNSEFKALRHWRREEFKSIAGFSGNLSLFNVVLYLSRNADSMIVGRLLGAQVLGAYSIAYRVMLFPVQNMSYVVSRALYPVMSRQQDNQGELARLYLKSVSFIAFLTAPLMGGLFALREPFVDVVLGPKWSAAAVVIAWLAPVGFIQSVISTTGAIFMTSNRTDLLLRIGVLSTVVQIAAFFVGAHWGVEGVAIAYLAASVVNAWPALHYSGRLIGVGFGDLLRVLYRSLLLTLAMCAAVRYVHMGLMAAGWSELDSLAINVILGAGVYLVGSLLANRPQVGHFISFFRRRPAA
ncbi:MULTISPECIES: MOP flippase family protein [unclassified Herbaspirillum]|uniref:MOP flippase family protein n=1 Tax=unclassified Herbaspirillum TaxID=2624150 RepID=UPI00116B300E|nr:MULTISPECIES: MOP flippase family protein [unclassified Herbaspirillum]MBB5392874.1 PST family polysaccharide transporter [Herbaspirillum sp. SJZ102]TQK04480.1 PST family polysaccharide transporter [Herbaspirillum sp. SJZ130]TQK09735.1 PST family polysaccharide transporter [Herbaspirillum sp. SJZ106]TWC65915.1 PST family polysaccharide transporter [Herbaspirillum sp. SJZ099]